MKGMQNQQKRKLGYAKVGWNEAEYIVWSEMGEDFQVVSPDIIEGTLICLIEERKRIPLSTTLIGNKEVAVLYSRQQVLVNLYSDDMETITDS